MATTRLVIAVLAFASLVQVLVADDPSCSAAEVGSIKCDTGCRTMGLCASEDSEGAWVPIETCTYGKVCDDAAGPTQCTLAPAPNCRADPDPIPTDTIACTDVGKYPSYENCHYYYECRVAGGNGILVACPTGYAFDSCSGTCLAGACTPQAGPCEQGEEGVDPKNNRNHYYCSGNTRHWSTCSEGYAYALEGGMCVETALNNGCISCFGKTGNAAFGGGETCRYLYCKDDGEIEVRKCSEGWYFNSYFSELKCAYGDCVSTIP